MRIACNFFCPKDSPLTELTLNDLGWSQHFNAQRDLDEYDTTTPVRVTAVHRAAIATLSPEGPRDLILPQGMLASDVAVGDWMLADPTEHRVIRRLERLTVLQRGTEYHTTDRQLIAANLDTLFITTSCNADFNVARLERYLALAHDAEVTPVILLTKADQADDPAHYVAEARKLGRNLDVIALNAKGEDVMDLLSPWCGTGQTVALAGSSGVGKTTIANALTGGASATQGIREDDARGRHTTTGRSLHRIPLGGWLIDTPGMRGLGVAEASAGIDATFPEISELVDHCKFRDCAHESEPGCAVQAALAAGDIDPDRLVRFKKLKREDALATENIAQARDRQKKFAKIVKSAVKKKKR